MAVTSSPLAGLVNMFARHVALDHDDREALLGLPVTMRRLDASAYLVREGEVPGQCVVLVSGYAYRQKLTGDGRRQICSLHIPGEVLDLQHLYLDVADHNVQTLTRAEVAFVPRAAIRDVVAARPAIARAALVTMLIEASIFREWILNVGQRDAQARLAHLLCEFAQRIDDQGLSDGDGYDLPMTQEQLGDALGLTAVHVNRTLKSLEASGLLTRNRRNVSFPHLQDLRQAADFNARYLHLGQQDAR